MIMALYQKQWNMPLMIGVLLRLPGILVTPVIMQNIWQYSFFIPQDMDGLIELMGGRKDFEMMLDSMFEQTTELLGKDTEDVTGQIGQYAHGNEPSHHVAYLYDFIGKPWETQYYTNKIIDSLYFNAPNGLCGNEDCK